ncbi:hypothetical protein LOTGIDRAFT_154982 [Lottia gigantea]|uniref:Uncharacterized protein n=1 Tax=Lottia gigantea TaxID=225164 RepID=V3Z4A2_LOTGI|nr:hypothetical protein LOTGIDRAFT_154982 [Lottia gigantea]ESO85493.1 hypothetical protein LOTGIDRAFT_154982 [Lottia gigantea]
MVSVILKETRDYAANLGIEKLIVWSDGCSAQYKSKLPFYFAAEAPDERAYFGSCHGKGPCDACGGVVKRIVDDDVMSGDVIIQSAESMYNYLSTMYGIPKQFHTHTLRSFKLISQVILINRSHHKH